MSARGVESANPAALKYPIVPPVVGKKRQRQDGIPEEPQFRQEGGVLLGFFWGGLRGLLVLQTQPLDLLEDLPAWIRSTVRREQWH